MKGRCIRPAVEISYLTEEQQYTLLEAMEYNDATPSLAQAIKMRSITKTVTHFRGYPVHYGGRKAQPEGKTCFP